MHHPRRPIGLSAAAALVALAIGTILLSIPPSAVAQAADPISRAEWDEGHLQLGALGRSRRARHAQPHHRPTSAGTRPGWRRTGSRFPWLGS